MKIFKTTDIRKIDEYTILHEPISSIDLMERAATSVFRWFIDKYTNSQPIFIFCGNGNNGGDGLALARLLANADFDVSVYILQAAEQFAGDTQINYERLKWLNKTKIEFLTDDFPHISPDSIIIDALFGSGLNRPLEGLAASATQHINQCNCTIISIDIPSGLFGEDNLSNDKNVIVRASFTLSFEAPKLAFLFPENEYYVGEWVILPIGLHSVAKQSTDTRFHYTSEREIKSVIKPRSKFAHKGCFGKALLIAGSYGMMGAAALAAKACYRTGAGSLKTHVPKCGVEVMQASVPESLISIDKNNKLFTSLPDNLKEYNAIAIGCGIGQQVETQNIFGKFLESLHAPIVLDADALNILAKHPDKIKLLPANSIITPHRKEFERIAGEWKSDYDCLMLQTDYAVKNKIIVVLKGAYTSIATPDGQIYFNTTGNAGMATAGSGDVLCGIILALLAQQYTPEIAALLGVYLHGLAGDIAKAEWGEEALIASDIIDSIGKAYKTLKG